MNEWILTSQTFFLNKLYNYLGKSSRNMCNEIPTNKDGQKKQIVMQIHSHSSKLEIEKNTRK